MVLTRSSYFAYPPKEWGNGKEVIGGPIGERQIYMQHRDLSSLATEPGHAYVLVGSGENPNQYYVTGYHAPDAFIAVYHDGELTVLTSSLEYTRAKDDSTADRVIRYAEYGYREHVERTDRDRAKALVLTEYLAENEIETVWVNAEFPLGVAKTIESAGFTLQLDEVDRVAQLRLRKTPEEINHIEQTQRATEKAMAEAEAMLRDARVEGDVLVLGDDVLTSERIRQRIEMTLIEHGCVLDNCLVCCGADAARAHEIGSGPIRPDINVTIDIFPIHKQSRYAADMTRTFVKGTAPDKIAGWYETVEEAHATALDVIGPGVTGSAVHDAVCDIFEAAGYPTLRTDERTEDGFFHSTGHGIGLEVHEGPSLGPDGTTLEPGNVVTVEPGLYEQGYGGVRIEDLVVVTEDGMCNLTDYHTTLEV